MFLGFVRFVISNDGFSKIKMYFCIHLPIVTPIEVDLWWGIHIECVSDALVLTM